MINQDILKLYRSKLPHGTMKLVAQRAGVSRIAVGAFFSGKTQSRRIESAVLDVIAELNADREKKLKKAGLL